MIEFSSTESPAVKGILFNLVYILGILCALPWLLYRRFRYGKYREGWSQKLGGELPIRTSDANPLIWIHAVSVGEVIQLKQIVDGMRSLDPSLEFLITTTTETGFQVAKEKLAGCQVSYFPLDFTWTVRKALQRVRPSMIVLVELELWPNFLAEASRSKIPVAVINGRMSDQSFNGYRKIRSLIKPSLQDLSLVAVQSEETRNRFVELGSRSDLVHVTGSIKFDGVEIDPSNPNALQLRDFFQLKESEFVWVAGSTQSPEEEMVLDIYLRVLNHLPKSRLIIVPRHPERGTEIAEMIERRGFNVIRRSSPSQQLFDESRKAVGLLDTVGELKACWALADVAFVGGSFGNRGGQNMIEPAAHGIPVSFGPNTRNFRQVVELLLKAEAVKRVADATELEEFIVQSCKNPDEALAMGERAKDLISKQQGATKTTCQLLLNLLGRNTAAAPEQSNAA
ncbi:3-deoxy-D-manno-octulosonic acid transferase [Thalassoglobus neptunius]|uniref:3-deoxy-D-manno-octulosonic acid transferase n=1 Tax=Thalassoglobus neptunius TaxID=1938619 RepID=UPI0018D22852|nr:3-deoxy-D-manno-octulosonic acid transferase [Thalassoglobus neptunius]